MRADIADHRMVSDMRQHEFLKHLKRLLGVEIFKRLARDHGDIEIALRHPFSNGFKPGLAGAAGQQPTVLCIGLEVPREVIMRQIARIENLATFQRHLLARKGVLDRGGSGLVMANVEQEFAWLLVRGHFKSGLWALSRQTKHFSAIAATALPTCHSLGRGSGQFAAQTAGIGSGTLTKGTLAWQIAGT